MLNGGMEISEAPCVEDCTGCMISAKRGYLSDPFFPISSSIERNPAAALASSS